MRVLHSIPRAIRGGAERSILLLSAGLMGRGHQVHLAAWKGEWVSRFRQAGVACHRLPLYPSSPVNLLACVILQAALVRRYRIDLLHSHHRFAALVARFVSSLTGVPHIETVHILPSHQRRLTFLGRGDKVIVFSEAVGRHLANGYGFEWERIALVPMGVEIGTQASPSEIQRIRHSLGSTGGGPLVGYVGRLMAEKGPQYLLEAIPEVLRAYGTARFCIVGDGELAGRLRARAAALAVEDRVAFLDGRDDVAPLLACFDLVVAPSLRESLGLTVLEAFAQGKPVIGTTVGGLPEVISHGVNGLLVAPGDSNALARAILDLLGDGERRMALGAAGRRLVEAKHSPQAMVEGTEEVYRAACRR